MKPARETLIRAVSPGSNPGTAVAVLKYRLYAIDRIISRVTSYVVITAVLGGIFAGLVILVAAALFNPLRRWVQRAVDHRFNRAERARTASRPPSLDPATSQAASGARGTPRRSRC